ncbi:unnamed protein product [Arctogadus glacialis]
MWSPALWVYFWSPALGHTSGPSTRLPIHQLRPRYHAGPWRALSTATGSLSAPRARPGRDTHGAATAGPRPPSSAAGAADASGKKDPVSEAGPPGASLSVRAQPSQRVVPRHGPGTGPRLTAQGKHRTAATAAASHRPGPTPRACSSESRGLHREGTPRKAPRNFLKSSWTVDPEPYKETPANRPVGGGKVQLGAWWGCGGFRAMKTVR